MLTAQVLIRSRLRVLNNIAPAQVTAAAGDVQRGRTVSQAAPERRGAAHPGGVIQTPGRLLTMTCEAKEGGRYG